MPIMRPVIRRLKKQDQQALTIIEQYIGEHFNQPIRVRDLCKMVNMSQEHLFRIFKWKYNETPIGHQTHLRMKKAAALLMEDSDLLIKQVAVLVGYKRAQKFGPAFKKYHGVTPSEFKARYDLPTAVGE